MLERMFEKQQSVEQMTHPFSSSRGIQLHWMQSECYADGMTAEVFAKFETEIDNANKNWMDRLSNTEHKVRVSSI